MKSTTNIYQRNYMLAKAKLETLESLLQKMEHDYIVSHNIVNPDGSTPKVFFMIEDEDVFNASCNEILNLQEFLMIEQNIIEMKKTLEEAEKSLINYGLSIAPKSVREILSKSVEINYTTRKKIIDLVLRLDASTVTI